MSWRPEWLLVFPGVAVLLTVAVLAVRGWRAAERIQRVVHVARVLVAGLVLVVALRPAGEHEVETPVTQGVDVVLMLDRTASMGALDHDGGRSRMEGAAEDLVEVVSGAAGARFSVVVFDDDARLLLPATSDVASVVTTLRTVGWRPSAKATGSDVSVAVALTRSTLEKLASEHPDHRRVLVYAGDGEQTQQGEPGSFAPLADLVDEAWVLGYGSEEGGVMPIAPDDPQLVTREGVEQRSVPDPDVLGRIAEQTGGTFVPRTAPGGLPVIGRPTVTTSRELVPGAEHYWILALSAVPFMLLALAVGARRLREVHDEKKLEEDE